MACTRCVRCLGSGPPHVLNGNRPTQRLLPSVRLYLQFSFVDFAAYLLGMVILAFRIYKPKAWKDDLCEEVSVHPDVLRALRSGGFNIESCESWVEKLVLGAMTMLGVGLVLKV